MNTNPDEEKLALWVEDELSGVDLREVEAWASTRAEWLERREQARSWKNLVSGVLPEQEEVPHGEFFNARIRREIEMAGREEHVPEAPAAKRTPGWAWFMPAAAAAGMVFGFVLGRGGPESPGDGVPMPVASLAPVLYTPTKGVKAEYQDSQDATVIVLAGVEAIPDTWEVPETAVLERKDGPRTAVRTSP